MSISGWLLGHQSGVFNGQWVCDTCPENMQKAADRFGGRGFLLGCERIFSEAGSGRKVVSSGRRRGLFWLWSGVRFC